MIDAPSYVDRIAAGAEPRKFTGMESIFRSWCCPNEPARLFKSRQQVRRAERNVRVPNGGTLLNAK